MSCIGNCWFFLRAYGHIKYFKVEFVDCTLLTLLIVLHQLLPRALFTEVLVRNIYFPVISFRFPFYSVPSKGTDVSIWLLKCPYLYVMSVPNILICFNEIFLYSYFSYEFIRCVG